MQFMQCEIPDVILIAPDVYGEDRGFFLESYRKSIFIENGISDEFIQDNHSRSAPGVLRGLHYQLNPKSQAKLVRCVRGKVYDVAVDIRQASPTFGKWIGYELSEENKCMLYIPNGFAHGFLSLAPNTELIYKTNNEYSPQYDRGILYNDPQIGIKWPKLDIELILSEKDKKQPLLDAAENNFKYVLKV